MSSRTGGRQTMSDLKLRRLVEHNQRLREDLARPRMKVSEASARWVHMHDICSRHSSAVPYCASLIRYCKTTKDHLVRGTAFDYVTRAHYIIFITGAIGMGTSRTSGRSIWAAECSRVLMLYDPVASDSQIPSPTTTTRLRAHNRALLAASRIPFI
jgi:hypothetical protein